MKTLIDFEKLKEQIILFSTKNEEPSWLLEYRLEQLALAQPTQLPKFDTVNLAEWNPTKITSIFPEVTDIETLNNNVNENQDTHFSAEDVYSNFELAETGVVLQDIFEFASNNEAFFRKQFLVQSETNPQNLLTHLHAATFNHGRVLIVPANFHAKKAIMLNLALQVENDANLLEHTLVLAGENSHFELIQNTEVQNTSSNNAQFFLEITAATGSKVKAQIIEQNNELTNSYFYRRAYVGQDANVDWNIASMNKNDAIVDLETELQGEGANSNSNVIAVTFGQGKTAVNNRINNYARHTIGNILQRGVLLDESELIFNGVGKIFHGAKGSNAQQENRILILSSEAHGNANPILLIDENDVQAGHAASVGKIDGDKMYYLLSRGLTEATAKKILIRSFLSSVLEKSCIKDYDKIVLDVIERKLNEI